MKPCLSIVVKYIELSSASFELEILKDMQVAPAIIQATALQRAIEELQKIQKDLDRHVSTQQVSNPTNN